MNDIEPLQFTREGRQFGIGCEVEIAVKMWGPKIDVPAMKPERASG